MRITIAGCDFELLGDPHRGRPFRNGVPLHRLGDRERMQSETMKASLKQGEATGVVAHVCMGDLFDKPKVANEVVAQVADEYQHAISLNGMIDWVCLTGNHDDSRDTGIVSSFHLFTKIMEERMFIVRSIPLRRYYDSRESQATCMVVFIPWHPLKTAVEMVNEHQDLIRGADAVFGHWDVDRRLEGTDNYIPAELLYELGVKLAITGHDHVARELELSGVKVIVTGSMQPYSHSEDTEGFLYCTVTADEARRLLTEAPEYFSNHCLRVVGEWNDPVPNCLQFKVVSHPDEDDAAEALASVRVADFNMTDLWRQSMATVDPEIDAELRARFAEIGGETE